MARAVSQEVMVEALAENLRSVWPEPQHDIGLNHEQGWNSVVTECPVCFMTYFHSSFSKTKKKIIVLFICL